MPEKFAVIGTGRTEFTDDSYKTALEEAVNEFSRSGKVKKDKWEDHFRPHPRDRESFLLDQIHQ